MKGVRVGQRAAGNKVATLDALKVSVFPTPLGYWGLLGQDDVLYAMTIGQPHASSAQAAFSDPFDGHPIDKTASDWFPELRQRLERYASGHPVTFSDIQVYLPRLTPFQRQIIEVTRALKHGETITYGELAARADRPRAARAVGTVMASNRIPIIIPCHRVVGAGGIGGYSAPQGLSLKSKLLELESQ